LKEKNLFKIALICSFFGLIILFFISDKISIDRINISEINKEELEQLKSEGKRKAEENIRNHFILKKIAENESIDVTDEEIHEEFKAIAKANNVPLAKVIDGVNKEGKRDEFKNNLILKKTVDFLLKHAIIE